MNTISITLTAQNYMILCLFLLIPLFLLWHNAAVLIIALIYQCANIVRRFCPAAVLKSYPAAEYSNHQNNLLL